MSWQIQLLLSQLCEIIITETMINHYWRNHPVHALWCLFRLWLGAFHQKLIWKNIALARMGLDRIFGHLQFYTAPWYKNFMSWFAVYLTHFKAWGRVKHIWEKYLSLYWIQVWSLPPNLAYFLQLEQLLMSYKSHTMTETHERAHSRFRSSNFWFLNHLLHCLQVYLWIFCNWSNYWWATGPWT